MDTGSLILNEMKTAHQWAEATLADVDNEVAMWQPGGTAHPIGSRYAHLVVTEDIFVQQLLQQQPPLFAGAWQGKTGMDAPEGAMQVTVEWANALRVDMEGLRAYASAVYASTYKYLGGLKDNDLSAEIDLSQFGFGKMSLASFLITFMLGHVRDIMGEISATKGFKGMRGYPF
ncbi:MAG: DinB family protein [Anaerolineae bacterium]|nr:MAG: DinB family protein [Anaerolineae bacterium]